MNAQAIRDALLSDSSDSMKARRKIIALSALGLLDFSAISLYQAGVINKLPDLPFSVFASNKINASQSAYQFGLPDGPVSATVYGITMMLAAAAGNKQSGRKPLFDALLGAAIAANAAGALYYLYDMVVKQKKICVYCVTGAAINLASAALVAPLVKKSIGNMRG